MEKDELIALFYKYRHNQCSPEEVRELIRYLKSGNDQQFVKSLIGSVSEDEFLDVSNINPVIQESLDRVFIRIQQQKGKTTVIPLYRRLSVQWSAAVLFIGLLVASLYMVRKAEPVSRVVNLEVEDIAPGGNRAQLVLSDGRVIPLSEAQSGIVISEDKITYEDGVDGAPLWSRSETTNDNAMLSITTPMGGTYRITLADGTHVWLNAASTLTYPIHFSKGERHVKLLGEGYFDVHPDAERPFRVESGDQVVEVLGTEFNVMAYPDEAEIKTTLVEGSVQLATGAGVTPLKPGEQSSLHEGKVKVEGVNVAPYIGWKENEFVFDGVELRDAMKRLGRWYDIDIVYEGEIPMTRFYGSFSRNLTLSVTLNILKEADINFSVHQTGAKKQLVIKP